ncbi:DUF5343 domain-containing protein [Gilvimarinus algae]|uniref:DUF5343 domain-containing protein n=1 Tax=Gilvimarinus algae TaxID=3058037 RepID=A0ABT8TD52_9GAMM|nr:DUF5343 domain-containing protein [Gilvimarinus sp. SDUM040014]MDO3382010.1 DUF5343 domain-containing protein [Gilvimarinus sp. SDUM040014]
MQTEKTDKKSPPPYVTYRSFFNFINGLRENGMPTHITRSTLPGSNSGKATMAASLRAMGLVVSDDLPTELMKQLTDPNTNYSEVLNEVLIGTYDFLSDPDFDIKNTTTDKVVEKIKLAGASGSTVTKCMAFFLSACSDANIEVSQYVKAPTPTRNSNGRRKAANKPKQAAENATKPQPTAGHQEDIPEGMERITVPLRGMEDGIIFFPAELEENEARKAVKAAVFILNSYYELEDEE